MVNAHLDTLELELRKLDGVRTVGFSSQHDVLYIQLFVQANAPAATLPFEATRIAQRHSNSPVAVELVRWSNLTTTTADKGAGLGSIFENTHGLDVPPSEPAPAPKHAGSIGSVPASSASTNAHQPQADEQVRQDEAQNANAQSAEEVQNEDQDQDQSENDIREEPTDFVDLSSDAKDDENVQDHEETFEAAIEEPDNEVDLASEEMHEADIAKIFQASNEEKVDDDRREEDSSFERIALLLVTTSSENDEIEVHLSFDELRTIGRAATNRGLLGAIDATVAAIAELTGSNEFHAEWARSLEPGAEHASLVAVGLTNSEGTDTRHGIAGGSSPIEAAARATLNALNRTAVLASSDQ